MLVLSRKPNESIVIDGRITVTVIEVRSGEVRLGIEAPRSIPVHRKEVYEAIQAENIAAGRGGVPDLERLGEEFDRRRPDEADGSAEPDAPAAPAAGEDSAQDG